MGFWWEGGIVLPFFLSFTLACVPSPFFHYRFVDWLHTATGACGADWRYGSLAFLRTNWDVRYTKRSAGGCALQTFCRFRYFAPALPVIVPSGTARTCAILLPSGMPIMAGGDGGFLFNMETCWSVVMPFVSTQRRLLLFAGSRHEQLMLFLLA